MFRYLQYSTKRFALGLIFVAASMFLPQSAFGANSYWVGSAGGDWSDANNWASTNPASCTGGGAGVPGAGDTAIFDADCDNNATMDANINVLGININSGYTGTISPSAAIGITIGGSGFVQAGGTFTSTSGTMTINSGGFNRTGGTFTHNSGTVTFSPNYGGVTITPGTSLTLYNATFSKVDPSDSDTATYSLAAGFTVAGNLTVQNTSGSDTLLVQALTPNSNPTITVNGNLSFPSTPGSSSPLYFGSSTPSSNITVALAGDLSISDAQANLYANVTFNGTGSQSVAQSAGVVSTGTWTVNKASGTLSPTTTLTTTSPLTVTAGTFDQGSYAVSFGAMTINGGTFTGGSQSITCTSLTESSGAFTSTSGTMTINSGAFNRTGGTFTHNSGTVTFAASNSGTTTITPGTSLTLYNATFSKVDPSDSD